MTSIDDASFTDVHIRENLSGDPILGVLAQAAQDSDLGISLTINVAGTIYSGTTVGRDRWFDMITEMAANSSAAAGQVVGSIRDGWTASFKEAPSSAPHYGYLHMRDVVTVNGGQVVGPKTLWRVQISEISAWTFGSFEVS